MEARKLLYTLLAAAPAFLMGGIGVHARSYVDPFEWPSALEDHARTQAYIPLVIETQARLKGEHADIGLEASQIAAKWITGAEIGALKPLPPLFLDEDSSLSCRGRVINTSYMLGRTLIDVADKEIEAGNFDKAAEHLMLASDSLNCLKYSSYISLYRVSLSQFSVLRRMESVFLRVSSERRKDLVLTMQRITLDESQAAWLKRRTLRLVRNQAETYRETYAPTLDSEAANIPGTLFEQPALAKGNGLNSEEELESVEYALPISTLEGQQCIAADRRNRLMIKKIISLSPNSVS